MGKNERSHTNNLMRTRQKDFGAKYRNGKIITKKGECINNVKIDLRKLEEGPTVEVHFKAPKATLKKYQTGTPLV